MSLRASIDIGSNSILLLLAKMSDGFIEVLENESSITGLGKDLDASGVFAQDSMRDSFDALEKYQQICRKHCFDPAQITATATEASRVAKNAPEFYAMVKEKLKIDVKIITGEAEAHYSAMGILFDKKINDDEITIMDIGGASTELIRVDTRLKKILHSFSMPVGAVRMTNWNEQGNRKEKLNLILKDFESDLLQVKTKKLYCVAGTMTSVGNMYSGNTAFIENEVNGLEFEKTQVNEMLENYQKFSADDFLVKFPFLGKRSKTILSGLYLAESVLSGLGVESVYISTYGLRYGTLLAGEIKHEFINSI